MGSRGSVTRRGRAPEGREWFAAPDPTGRTSSGERGLRFECTMCGACCTGPPGYVLVSDAECAALARRLGLSVERFVAEHTHTTGKGRSLNERETEHGFDCIFLDRESVPGRAVCGVYEDRPTQCRTWPFWPENVRTPRQWDRTGAICPGVNRGALVPPERIRVLRDQTRT